MRKLIVGILAVGLILGLAGIGLAIGTNDDQTITGDVTETIEFTAPDDITNFTLDVGTNTDQSSGAAAVSANCPYTINLKAATAETVETVADGQMTADNNSSEEDLASTFQFKYSSGCESADDSADSYIDITTSDQVLVGPNTPPNNGTDAPIAYYKQVVAYGDPGQSSHGTNLSYKIKIVWTISGDIT